MKFRNTLCAIYFSFILLSCEEIVPQSLLWKITGDNIPSPSYIYGTIHLKDQRVFAWRDSVFSRISQCNAFAGEIDLSMDNLMQAANLMLLPEGQTLHDRFTPDEYKMVEEAIRNCSGYDLSTLDKLKPMALVSLCFLETNSEELEATVDEILYNKALSAGKKAYGLEKVEEQMALLDKIPDQYVVEYFQNMDQQDDEFEDLIRNYIKADLDSIYILMQDEESGTFMNDEFIRYRNYRMAARVIPIINRQTTFIAIGAGHLPGNEGVLELLRNEGFVLEPVKIW